MELWQRLKQTKKPIVLYGMGNGADKILDILNSKGITASGVFASDDFCRNQTFRGFVVRPYAEQKKQFGDMIVLVAFGTHRSNVIENILKIMGEQETYAPDVPLFGETLFDEKYMNENQAAFEQLFERLADEKSKETLECIIKSKLTGEIEPLVKCQAEPMESLDFLCFGQGEVFLDGGAYNGDTVLSFVKSVPNYETICAVEPDRKNFQKLMINTELMQRIEYINAPLFESDTQLCFAQSAGRQSAVCAGGESVFARSVDSILNGNRATYIKYDVEGQEIAALRGSRKTIARFAPRLCVSAYHKTEDLIEIPRLVLEMNNDYDVYLRHFESVPAWDTMYYFVKK